MMQRTMLYTATLIVRYLSSFTEQRVASKFRHVPIAVNLALQKRMGSNNSHRRRRNYEGVRRYFCAAV